MLLLVFSTLIGALPQFDNQPNFVSGGNRPLPAQGFQNPNEQISGDSNSHFEVIQEPASSPFTASENEENSEYDQDDDFQDDIQGNTGQFISSSDVENSYSSDSVVRPSFDQSVQIGNLRDQPVKREVHPNPQKVAHAKDVNSDVKLLSNETAPNHPSSASSSSPLKTAEPQSSLGSSKNENVPDSVLPFRASYQLISRTKDPEVSSDNQSPSG